MKLAWGGTQVQNAPTFLKEVKLPVELDKLEGSSRPIAAHRPERVSACKRVCQISTEGKRQVYKKLMSSQHREPHP